MFFAIPGAALEKLTSIETSPEKFLVLRLSADKGILMLFLNESTVPAGRRGVRSPLPLLLLLGFLSPSLSHAQIELVCDVTPLPAQCETYEFTARVSLVTDPDLILGGLEMNDIVVGTVTYNTGVTDIDPDPAIGEYRNAPECARIDLAERSIIMDIDDDPTNGEPFIIATNDLASGGGGATAFTDAVSLATGGFGLLDIDALLPLQDPFGLGFLTYNLVEVCVQGFQSPCPPPILTSPAIPGAIGDVSDLMQAELGGTFVALNQGGVQSGSFQADLLSFGSSAPVECPEPGFGLSVSVALAGLFAFSRKRRPGVSK